MKVYTYSEARQRLARLLDTARKEEVLIRRRGEETFSITYKTVPKSPFDVPGIATKATTADILEAIRESRSGEGKPSEPSIR
ncbi:MAG TPA: type II toxin-antitoxin system Phd/YefM family antitoxin [bacterium]|nr:type II toxin-antitoxin system Phd/YefM family antitoxin [bacterium]HQL63550.1 type II toxin-antitoxin system Phd/YefM family antitoxin [bacterium]